MAECRAILARSTVPFAHCAESSYVDCDRPIFSLRTFTSYGWSFLGQAVADFVKGIMDKAGTVKPIDLFLAFLSRDEAAACGDPVCLTEPDLWVLPS